MPLVTEAHIEARRQQILDAAAACFSRDGFHRTTMHSICRESGLSPGAVYHYFSHKEAIIRAMSEAELRRNLALIEEITAQGATREVLSHLADAFFQRLNDNSPASCRVTVEIWSESLRNPDVGDSLRERVERQHLQFTEIVRLAQSRGEINPRLDPAAVARIMLSAFYGLVLQKALDPSVDVPAYVDALKALHFGEFWLAHGPPTARERRRKP